jgi:hypothetical protein
MSSICQTLRPHVVNLGSFEARRILPQLAVLMLASLALLWVHGWPLLRCLCWHGGSGINFGCIYSINIGRSY